MDNILNVKIHEIGSIFFAIRLTDRFKTINQEAASVLVISEIQKNSLLFKI